MAESKRDKIRVGCHKQLRVVIHDSLVSGSAQTNYVPCISAALDLVNDLKYPTIPGDTRVVPRPTEFNKGLLDQIGLTICTLQDLHAEYYRHGFNKGMILRDDDQQLVTTFHASYHLSEEEALTSVKPRTGRGRPPTKSKSGGASKGGRTSTAAAASPRIGRSGQMSNLCHEIGLDFMKIREVKVAADISNFCNMRQKVLIEEYVDDDRDEACLLDAYSSLVDELKTDKEAFKVAEAEWLRSKRDAEREWLGYRRRKEDLSEIETEAMNDAVKKNDVVRKKRSAVTKLAGKAGDKGSIKRTEEKKKAVGEKISRAIHELKDLLKQKSSRPSPSAFPASPAPRQPVPRRRSSGRRSEIGQPGRKSPARVDKMVETVLVECAHAIDQHGLTSSRDLYSIPSVESLRRANQWSPPQMDAICKRILKPEDFNLEAKVTQWREKHRNRYMKGLVLRTLQLCGEADDQLTGCQDGNELYECYEELFEDNGNLLPIFKDLPLATIKGAYLAIILALDDHVKVACEDIFTKGEAYFNSKKTLNSGVWYVPLDKAPPSLRSSPKQTRPYNPAEEAARPQLGDHRALFERSRGSDPGGRHADFENADRTAQVGADAAREGLKRSLSRSDKPKNKRSKSDENDEHGDDVGDDSDDDLEGVARRLPSTMGTPAESGGEEDVMVVD